MIFYGITENSNWKL